MRINHVKRHAVIQPLNESYRFIPLTQGQNAIVDAEDFEWLSQWNWCVSKIGNSFYAVRANSILMHRKILHCRRSSEQGDHKNGNTLDNRKNNLRKCSNHQNTWNVGPPKNNTSGFKGVSFRRDIGWYARIRVNGERIWLGYFDSAEVAARAYDAAAKSYHGEFAHLNLPGAAHRQLLLL